MSELNKLPVEECYDHLPIGGSVELRPIPLTKTVKPEVVGSVGPQLNPMKYFACRLLSWYRTYHHSN